MLVLAVTLHNIPEGMAVGGSLCRIPGGRWADFCSRCFGPLLGIAIQNFPEGAIISMPLRAEGMNRSKAFIRGILSGVVEPVGALLTIWLRRSSFLRFRTF